MADNVQLNTGSSGDVLGADEIGGVKFQRVKIIVGADGVNDGDVSGSNPIPIDVASIDSSVDLATETTLATLAGTVKTDGGAKGTTGVQIAGVDASNLTQILSTSAQGYLNIYQQNEIGLFSTHNEEETFSDGDAGEFVLAVRQDADIANQLDGDYAPFQVDGTGFLKVNVKTLKAGSVVDANNSTTTPLVGDANFIGATTDLLGYSAVCITLHADESSATDGMTFEFSTDDSDWDDAYLFEMTADASNPSTRRFQFPVCARYFRVNYTNGSAAQSVFRVQTILHTANQLTSIHRLSNDMSPDRSAQVVKSVLFAQAAGSGDFVAIDSTAGGNLKVSLEEVDGAVDLATETTAAAIQAAVDLIDDAVHVEGDTSPASVTGIALAWDDSGTMRTPQAAYPLPVQLNGDSVGLALEGSGNLEAVKNAVEVMDDWDESDRAKVNPVVGQAGLAAGTGVDAVNALRVSLATDIPLPAGTNAIGDVVVAGDVAHDTGDGGNPVKIGAKAVAHGASPTAVAAGDRTNLHATTDGVQFVIAGHPNTVCESQTWTADATNEVQVAVGSGQKFVVTSVVALASNGNASDTQVLVEFDDSSDKMIVEHPGIPPGGGFTWGNGGGILAVGGEGHDVLVTLDGGSGESTNVTITGYEIEA